MMNDVYIIIYNFTRVFFGAISQFLLAVPSAVSNAHAAIKL